MSEAIICNQGVVSPDVDAAFVRSIIGGGCSGGGRMGAGILVFGI